MLGVYVVGSNELWIAGERIRRRPGPGNQQAGGGSTRAQKEQHQSAGRFWTEKVRRLMIESRPTSALLLSQWGGGNLLKPHRHSHEVVNSLYV